MSKFKEKKLTLFVMLLVSLFDILFNTIWKYDFKFMLLSCFFINVFVIVKVVKRISFNDNKMLFMLLLMFVTFLFILLDSSNILVSLKFLTLSMYCIYLWNVWSLNDRKIYLDGFLIVNLVYVVVNAIVKYCAYNFESILLSSFFGSLISVFILSIYFYQKPRLWHVLYFVLSLINIYICNSRVYFILSIFLFWLLIIFFIKKKKFNFFRFLLMLIIVAFLLFSFSEISYLNFTNDLVLFRYYHLFYLAFLLYFIFPFFKKVLGLKYRFLENYLFLLTSLVIAFGIMFLIYGLSLPYLILLIYIFRIDLSYIRERKVMKRVANNICFVSSSKTFDRYLTIMSAFSNIGYDVKACIIGSGDNSFKDVDVRYFDDNCLLKRRRSNRNIINYLKKCDDGFLIALDDKAGRVVNKVVSTHAITLYRNSSYKVSKFKNIDYNLVLCDNLVNDDKDFVVPDFILKGIQVTAFSPRKNIIALCDSYDAFKILLDLYNAVSSFNYHFTIVQLKAYKKVCRYIKREQIQFVTILDKFPSNLNIYNLNLCACLDLVNYSDYLLALASNAIPSVCYNNVSNLYWMSEDNCSFCSSFDEFINKVKLLLVNSDKRKILGKNMLKYLDNNRVENVFPIWVDVLEKIEDDIIKRK